MVYLLSFILGIVFFGLLLAPLLFWDKGRRSVSLALRSLRLHKLRTFLSVLGIIIGNMAVITLMAFGEGNMQDALEDIKRQGATNIIIRSVKTADNSSGQRRNYIAIYGLTDADFERFITISDIIRHVPMRVFPQKIYRLERSYGGRVVGTTPDYSQVNQLELASGRFLASDDDHYMRNIAVLGSDVADSLFPFEDPLDQTVRLGLTFYKVVGVLKERMPTGGSGGSQATEDFNQDVYIPLKTCNVRFGARTYFEQSGSRSWEQVQLHQVTLTISDIDKVRPVGESIRGMLERYHLKKDYAVTVPLDRLEEAERAKKRGMLLLVMIASFSLLVGGIGIMNIMLATVTERTREIGIRRALGAKRRDITMQFLIEAVAQTTVGGLVGVLLGFGAIYGIPLVPDAAGWLSERLGIDSSASPLWDWLIHLNIPAKIHVPSIFISLAVSVGVGVLFGLYPAYRASRLDPIEALRHE